MNSTDSKSVQDDGRLFPLVLVGLALGAFWRVYQTIRPAVLLAYHRYYYAFLLARFGLFTLGGLVAVALLWNVFVARRNRRAVTEESNRSIFLGTDLKSGQDVHLWEEFRSTHMQVIGTTGCGKTASVILPSVVQDIQAGRGVLIIDGKADRSFLDQVYAHAAQAGREKDFLLFSLTQPRLSHTFNPFGEGSPDQITERVFSALPFTDEYYKSIQYSALRTIVAVLMQRGQVPLPGMIRALLMDREKLKGWSAGLSDENLISDARALMGGSQEDFDEKYSGLITALGHFSQGAASPLFNSKSPEITLPEVIRNRRICYFQLPTMGSPFLGAVTGKLVLQCLQSAISDLQVRGQVSGGLFAIYLDDFNDYIYDDFISILNKSRSAGIGVVFSHQSLGDLEKLGPGFTQSFLTNTNIRIIMRSSHPETAEYFANEIGTQKTEKKTHRRNNFLPGVDRDTGEQSVREVEEYRVHPNVFKSELRVGEAVAIIPYPDGRIVKRVGFKMVARLPALNIPPRDLPVVNFSEAASCPDAVKQKRKQGTQTTKPDAENYRSTKQKSTPKTFGGTSL